MRRLVPVVACLGLCFSSEAGALDQAQARVLVEHNRERAAWGVPALRWDHGLAREAELYAAQLASSGQWRHSASLSADRGENLWMGTRGAYRPSDMVGSWLQQRARFVPGRFPQVSRTGRWSDVGHYSQIVWRGTTHVGCAIRSSASADYLVCRYGPAGNVVGRGVF